MNVIILGYFLASAKVTKSRLWFTLADGTSTDFWTPKVKANNIKAMIYLDLNNAFHSFNN